jgi:hypothetical protein
MVASKLLPGYNQEGPGNGHGKLARQRQSAPALLPLSSARLFGLAGTCYWYTKMNWSKMKVVNYVPVAVAFVVTVPSIKANSCLHCPDKEV